MSASIVIFFHYFRILSLFLSYGFLLFYCLFLAFYRLFLSSVRSTNYWVIWVNLVGGAGRGQCTDLASWPLHKMYMLLLAVSVHVYPDLMLFKFLPHQRDHRHAIFQSTPKFLCV